MRILTLRSGDTTLALHPRVTVVTGLPADRRHAVVSAVAGVATGALPEGVSGLLEAHGVQFPLEARLVEALDLPADVDAVLRPTDLPGGAVPPGELMGRLSAARRLLAERSVATAVVRERLDEAMATAGLAERRPELLAELETRRAELLRAEAALTEARAGAIEVHLTDDDVHAIEAVHDQVVEAEARAAHARLATPMARKRLREAERAEREVLARFGLPSYGAYLLRTATMHVDPETARSLAELDAQRAEAEKALTEMREELARCDATLADSEQVIAEARRALEEASTAEEQAAATVEALERRLAASSAATAAPPVDAGDVEVYVLARLAGVRAGGCAGSVPLAVDDVLVGAPPNAHGRILELLDRLSVVVQIVYVTDDEGVCSWAQALGAERAAVVTGERTSGPSTA